MEHPPFPERDELYRKLYISPDCLRVRRKASNGNTAKAIQTKGATADQTINTDTPSDPTTAITTPKRYVPGQPRVSLDDEKGVNEYLGKQLKTEKLDELEPFLWLVAKQDSSHVSELTLQKTRGREKIVITENPELHLVWIYDRIFIKPIPKYLLSHAFWKVYLSDNGSWSRVGTWEKSEQKIKLAKAAKGFLRSWAHLIKHKSDFEIATDKPRLIPKDIKYAKFIKFIQNFENIEDKDVSPRYQYGELRLTRLNTWTKILLRGLNFHKVHGQYGAYFGRFYAPILFVFGAFSVTLSALQVVRNAQASSQENQPWPAFATFSRSFAVFTLTYVATVVVFLLTSFFVLGIRETRFAVKDRINKERARNEDVARNNTIA